MHAPQVPVRPFPPMPIPAAKPVAASPRLALLIGAGAPVAIASTSVKSEIGRNADGFLDADLQVLRDAPVATWSYRLAFELADAKGSVDVFSADRTVRGAAPPETWREGLTIESEDLLVPQADRFDDKQLRLEPLVLAYDQTHDPVYLTEIVNTTSDVVALRSARWSPRHIAALALASAQPSTSFASSASSSMPTYSS